MVGQVVLGKVAAFPQHRHLGNKLSIRPWAPSSKQDHQPKRFSAVQHGGRQGCPPLGPPQNQFPADLKFSLIIVARASCVDHVGSLGFQQDLSHTYCLYMLCHTCHA